MNKFIRNIILFTLPIVLFGIGAEYILRQIPNNYSYKNDYLSKNAQNIEILVLGSSHSFYGINPAYFSINAFNAAHLSQSLKYDYFIFDKYKKDLSNLEVLVIPVSYFTLFTRLEKGIEDWRVKYYSIYYNCKYHSELKYNSEIISQKPFAALEMIGKYLSGKSNITVSQLGFGTKYSNVKQSDLIATGISAAKRHTRSELDLLDTNLELLTNLISESNIMGVNVVLFTPPARESYTENLNIHQLSVMRATISNVVKAHSNAQYYDFSRDTLFVDDDFKDADHLNGVGAKKLTEIIDYLINDGKRVAYIDGRE